MAINTFNFMTLENLTTYHGELTAWAQAQIANATASSIKTVSISKDETTGVSTMHFYTVDAPVGEAQAAFSIELPHDYYTIAEIDELAQGLNGEIARVEGKADTAQAAADKAQEDVDALAGKVGDIPVDAEGVAEAETVIAYIDKKAQEVLESASGNGAESAAAVEEKLDNYMASNDQAVADVDAKADGIAQDLADEVERATGKEAELAQAIADEQARAEGKEAEIVASVTAEKERAEGKEAEIAQSVVDVNTALEAYKTSNDTALANEIARATAAEEANAAAIKAEKERMDAFMEVAEGESLDTALDTLKELQDYITSEASAADEIVKKVGDLEAIVDGIGGEDEEATVVGYVTKAVEAEKTRAEAKEAELAAADTQLRTDMTKAVSDEQARAEKAEQDLTTAIETEAVRATAAEAKALEDAKKYADEKDDALKTELQGVIDGVDAKFDGYYTKAETDVAIDADVLVETNRATAAEGVLSDRIDELESVVHGASAIDDDAIRALFA